MKYRWLLLFAMLLTLSLMSTARAQSFIDTQLDADQGSVRSAALCSDSEFLRRVSLDLSGIVPTADDASAFLAGPDREKLIDRLLAIDEFNVWWGRFLLEQTTDRRAVNFDDEYNGRHLFDWFKAQLRARQPYDKIVHDLITAQGTADGASPVHFLLRYKVRPADLTGAVGRALLGTRLQCAQCHDHPFDKYTQEDFWGVAAFFARTRRFEIDDGDIQGVTEVRRGSLEMPDEEGKKVVARWLGSRDSSARAGREELAKFVVADPLFAKNIVNRVWARLMGRGIVEPIDSFGNKTNASHPELLDQLAKEFVNSKFDLRALIRTIVSSKTYQSSCKGEGEPAQFAHALMRPLTADQLFLSIERALHYTLASDDGDEEVAPATEKDKNAKTEKNKEMKPDAKNVGAPNDLKKELVAQADEDDLSDDEIEKLDDADNKPIELLGAAPQSLRRSLSLLNHSDIHGAVESGAKHLVDVHGENVGSKHFDALYLSLLSRLPNDEEQKWFTGKHKQAQLEDAIWALLNSAEFKYNH